MKKADTAIILDTRRALKDGKYPVKLRITYLRKQKYYTLPFNFSEQEFEQVKSLKPKKEFKTIQLELQAIEQRAVNIIKDLDDFTFESFEKKLLNKGVQNDVFSGLQAQVDKLKGEGRVGTADSYKCALKSLSTFSENKSLPYSSITPDFLRSYEKWMLTNGRSLTTVGIYIRALRALYNEAISQGEAKVENYPFGKRRYQIPAGRNNKKALVLSDIEKIFKYEPKTNSEARARDLWIFSYLCNGINIKDIARLKYKNVDPEKITFIRAKTELTSRQNLKPIVAMVTPEIEKIISKWGNKPSYPESFVFPILQEGITPEKELATVRQATKTINTYIKRVAKAVKIEKDISTYTARHSFSTVLKRAGASIEFISESLGHSNLKTTESYLDSFEDKIKQQFSHKLTEFTSNTENNG